MPRKKPKKRQRPAALEERVQFLLRYGYLDQEQADGIKSDLSLVFRTAVAKFQRLDINIEIAKEHTAEPLLADGVIGPATELAMQTPRCGCPDVGAAESAPLIGSGGWRGCHGVGDAHAVVARWNYNNFPSFLRPHWKQVLINVRRMYAQIGLLWHFVDGQGIDQISGKKSSVNGANVECSFRSLGGPIGLAIVGHAAVQKCSSNIWARYEPRYQPRNIASEWTSLCAHEFGHSCGLRHSRGGVMNPSLIAGLPGTWSNDPSESTLKRWFSGVPFNSWN